MRILAVLRRVIALCMFAALMVACGSGNDSTQNRFTAFKLPAALEEIASTRMIDRDALFAEIILQYEETSELVIASRSPETDVWRAEFRLPAGHDFSIQLTWFDRLDGGRLDLVRFNRNFPGTFSSGPLSFDFADYDFDGYDADSDGVVNLVERQSGSSPLLADGADAPVQLCDDGTVLPPGGVCVEDAEPLLDLPVAQLDLTAQPASVASNNIVLANTGNIQLEYSAVSNSSWLQLAGGNSQAGVIEVGQSISLAVAANCSDAIEQLDGAIDIDSNGGSGSVSVALDCRGALLGVTPQLYQFAADIVGGVGQSDSANMLISNSGNEPLDYSISSDSGWLCPTGTTNCASAIATGSVPSGQSASVTVAAVCPNSEQMLAGSLSIVSNGGTAVLPATLNCTLAPAPELQLSTEAVTFSGTPGDVLSTEITVSNTGNAGLNYSVVEDVDWLSFVQSEGSLEAGSSTALSVQAACGELTETLSGSIAVNSNAGNASIPVTLVCAELPAPMLMFQAEALSLSAEVPAAAATQVLISNTGSTDLEYSVSSISTWLQLPIGPATLGAGASDIIAVQASCASGSGMFNGSIDIASNGGSGSIPVVLECTEPTAPLLVLQTAELVLASEQSATAISDIVLSNSGSAVLNYQISSDSDWLLPAVSEGAIDPGANAPLPVMASCGAIVETRTGMLTVASDGGTDNIGVSLSCTEIPLPVLSVLGTELALAAEQNQSVAGAIVITNTGSAELNYSASADADWLQIGAADAALAAGESVSLVVNGQCGTTVEVLSTTLLIDSDGGGASVPVTLNCSAAPAPLLQAPTTPVSLAALQNQTVTDSFVLQNDGTAPLAYTLASDSAWLQPGALQGALDVGASATIAYEASCGDVVETRAGIINIDSDGGSAQVAVSLNCSAAPIGVLNVLADELLLDALQNNTATAGFAIENTGTAALDFSVSSDSAWLQVDAPTNTLNPGEDVTVSVSASCTEVVESRNGVVAIESAGDTTEIPVTLRCNAPPVAELSVTPSLLSLLADVEGGASGEIEISNLGTAILDYSIATADSWLQTETTSALLDIDATAVVTITASCGGSTGVLESEITVGGNGGTVIVPVTLNCSSLASPLLELQTAQLSLVAGRSESTSAEVQLENTGSSDLTVDLSADVDWISAATANPLIVTPGEVATATFAASCGNVVEVRSGEILLASDGGSGTVPVTLDCRGAILRVEPLVLSWSSEIDVVERENLTFHNDGNELLDFTVTSNSDWLCTDEIGARDCSLGAASFSTSVEPGEFYVLPVAATCGSVPETRNGLFSVDSNGGTAEVPVELSCSDTPQPQLVLTPSSLVANPVDLNTSVSQQITLGNTGTALLNYTVLSEQDWIVVPDESGTLEPDQFIDIDVQLICGVTPGPFVGQLMVSWDLADEILPVNIGCEDFIASVTQINVDGGTNESGNEMIWGRPTPVQVIGESFSSLAGVQIDGGTCDIDSVTSTEVIATCTVTNPVFRDSVVELLVSDVESTGRSSVGSAVVYVDPTGYNRVDEIDPLSLVVGEAVEITATGIFNSTISVSVSDGSSFSDCAVLSNGLIEIVALCSLPDASYTQLVFSAADGVEVESGVASVQPIVPEPSLGCPVIPEAQSNVNNEPLLVYDNPVRFTDDFNNGLPRYNASFFGSADADNSLSIANGTATLSVTGTASGSSAANIEPVIVGDPDSLFVRVQIPSESTAVDSADSDTDSRFRLVGNFFNSVNDGGVVDPAVNYRAGDVQLTLKVRNYQEDDASSDFLYCAQVIGDDGGRGFFVDFTEDGDGDGCATIDSLPVDLEFGREYLLGIGVDRAAGTVFFQVDDTRVSDLVPTPILRAKSPSLFAGVAATGASVSSVAHISEIAVDGNIDTTLSDLLPGVVDRYKNLNGFNSQPNASVVATGGQVEIRGSSEEGGSTFTNLTINGDTDYIAADLVLSGDSVVEDGSSHATVRIGATVYNDLSNGGIDGSMEGDVGASVEILSQANGATNASACMSRLQTDGFGEVCSVIAPDSFCLPFNTPVQSDVSYRTSIEMDRENRRVVFRLNDEEIVHDIQTNAFLPSAGRKSVSTRMRGAGVAVGIADNLSTINPVNSDGN